jgi:hypothetical protein
MIYFMQFVSFYAWGEKIIFLCSLLIRPLLYYVFDVRPEHNHTIFNHPLPFVASQSTIVGTISRWRQYVMARRAQVSVARVEREVKHARASAGRKRLFGRQRMRGEGNITMDRTELIWGIGDKWNWLWIVSSVEIWYYSSLHQIACFKVTAKSYNVAARTAEPKLVKTAQNSQRSNAVLVPSSGWLRCLGSWNCPHLLRHTRRSNRPDDGGSKHLWIVGKILPDYTAQQPRSQRSLYSPPWEP